jgi:hypothetical protein
VQHQPIDIDEPTAAGAFDLGDGVGEFGVVGFFE